MFLGEVECKNVYDKDDIEVFGFVWVKVFVFWWRWSLNFEFCIEFRVWLVVIEEENIVRIGVFFEVFVELFNYLIWVLVLIRFLNNFFVLLFCIFLGKLYIFRIWLIFVIEKKMRFFVYYCVIYFVYKF